VLLSGDAGIGKSRLVLALREHIGMEQHLALECQCLPYYASSALYPVADGLTRLLGLPMTGSDTERLAALTGSPRAIRSARPRGDCDDRAIPRRAPHR